MDVFSKSPVPIVYPMHPRTRKRFQENQMLSQMEALTNVLVLPPLGNLDFLILMKNCKLIITDSGGIQEEATSLISRKSVLVMRLLTERPEAVETGFDKVIGTDVKNILKDIEAVDKEVELPHVSPFGEGTAASKTVEVLRKSLCLRYVSCLLIFFFTCLFSLQSAFFFNLLQTSHHCFRPSDFLVQSF